MDENLFGMSIKDIHTDKSLNLANEYNFKTIDEDLAAINKAKSSKATNAVSSDEPNENNTNMK